MKKSVSIFWKIYFLSFGLVIVFILLCNWGVFGEMPAIEDIKNPAALQSSQVYASDGTLMGKFYLQDRINVPFKDISPFIINALVATEDKRFYSHSGVDLKSLLRAMKGLGMEGGASTITMQTAKNLFTENWATRNFFLRAIQKVKEAIIAVKLETNLSKEEILTLYLNTVEFSDNVFGIRNAAKTFFQKEPDRVNLDEAATLVGMVNGPGRYNPRKNPKQALDRRNLVLNRMFEAKFISDTAYKSSIEPPIVLNYKKLDENNGLGPYFRMIVGELMKKWCKEHKKADGSSYDLYRDGLRIYTTINPLMQFYAEEAVAKHLNYLQKVFNGQSNIKNATIWNNYTSILEGNMKQTDRWRNLKREGLNEEEIKKTFDKKVPMRIFAWNSKRETDTLLSPLDSLKYCRQMLQAGFLAMDPLSGEIKAWVGGIDFKNFKYDHVNQNTRRQVGSTIKPLLYALAIEEAGMTPSTIVEDVQQSFGTYGLVPATDKTCTGTSIPMAQALAQSRNCATAYVLKQLDATGNNGAKKLVDFLRKNEVTSPIDPYPSLALGASDISLIEMLQAYTIFPSGGFNVKPFFITRIEDKNGNVLENFSPQRKEVINEVTAYSVTKMLQGVMNEGTGRRMWRYGVSGEIAGKTGTTNNNSDAWFIGFTPQILAGAWVGCDDRFIRFTSTYEGQGAAAALPIWAYFYEKVTRNSTLGIDNKSSFVKPNSMPNDIPIDSLNNFSPELMDNYIENVGTLSSDDYAPSHLSSNPPKAEEIGAESTLETPLQPAEEKKKPIPSTSPKAVMPNKSNKKN